MCTLKNYRIAVASRIQRKIPPYSLINTSCGLFQFIVVSLSEAVPDICLLYYDITENDIFEDVESDMSDTIEEFRDANPSALFIHVINFDKVKIANTNIVDQLHLDIEEQYPGHIVYTDDSLSSDYHIWVYTFLDHLVPEGELQFKEFNFI